MKRISFHYDVDRKPTSSDYCDNTIVCFMHMGAIPKEYFFNREFDNLFSPQEMEKINQEIEQSIHID